MKKKAFTLAEVLVTLSIIAVVAALSIPSLVKSYQKQQWITGYKSVHSTLNQAAKMIAADNNSNITGLWTNSQTMYQVFLPYLKTIKQCENIDPNGQCFASNNKFLNNNASSWPDATYSVILSNGASVSFYESTIYPSSMFVDVNGLKGPNIVGKDIHFSYISSNGEFKPYGSLILEVTLVGWCPDDLNAGFGTTCGSRILRGDYGASY